MLRSLPSSQDAHETHLRSLIDQRNARADIHSRYSAVSEASDTPSVYSRAFFSPQQQDNQNDYGYASPASSSLTRPYNPHLYENSSMLDLEDDPRSSFAPSESQEEDEDKDSDDDKTYEQDEDDEARSRMSYLGPKMRFHSRAPWELEDSALDEVDEPEENPRHLTSGFPFGRSSASNRTSASSSPRPSYASRPSGESSRSHVPPKRSFETISSQVSHPRGALYALAQESLSATSLARSPAPHKETLRTKFSIGRLRADSSSNSIPPSPSVSNHRFPPPTPYYDQHTPSFDSPIRSPVKTSYDSQTQISSSGNNIHPYANPDLVVSYVEPPTSPVRLMSNFPLQHNSSTLTVTESSTSDSLYRSGGRPSLADTSVISSTRSRTTSAQLKNISSPISVAGPANRPDIPDGSDFPPGVNNLPGWSDRNPVPTFSLISLEEARAQRMRSVTANPASRMSTSSSVSDASPPFPPGSEQPMPRSADDSPFGSLSSRARGRSVSAGAKAKNAIQTIVGQPKPDRRGSEPAIIPQQAGNAAPPKTLKHKKSGFMRLFKGQEKEDREQPPPVPSLPDTHVYNPSPTQRTLTPNVHRIPVPSLSPSLMEAVNFSSSNTLNSESDSDQADPQTPKRHPPYLSINTNYQQHTLRHSPSVNPDRHNLTKTMPPSAMERPWRMGQQPQSAPANATEFPALKLRPVSTLFSAHFAEHIVPTNSRSSVDTDLDTPRSSSPNGIVSPITPGSQSRSSGDNAVISSVSDDPSSSIKALQDQMATSRKAWQRQVRELEDQVRDLQAELASLKTKNKEEYCQSCGQGRTEAGTTPPIISVIHRPRARTGNTSRFVNTLP